MKLDPRVIAGLTVGRRLRGYLRVLPLQYAATPLGLGHGQTRFASPSHAFRVLYLGKILQTAVAETLIRDRFVGRAKRTLTDDDIEAWGVAEVRSSVRLTLVDLRSTGLLQLGVPTNAVRGKVQASGRRLSETIHAASTDIDGLLYPSRLTGGDCIAIYDRAVGKLAAGPVHEIVELKALESILTGLSISVVRAPASPRCS